MREIITLQCPDCKNRNYSTTKNKKTTTGRLEFLEILQYVPEAHGPQGNEVAKGYGAGGQAMTSAFSQKFGGVSSTVKLSVSKTELLGSNPSSPAS